MKNIKNFNDWSISEREDVISKDNAADAEDDGKTSDDTNVDISEEINSKSDSCIDAINSLIEYCKENNKNYEELDKCSSLISEWKESLNADKDSVSMLSHELEEE